MEEILQFVIQYSTFAKNFLSRFGGKMEKEVMFFDHKTGSKIFVLVNKITRSTRSQFTIHSGTVVKYVFLTRYDNRVLAKFVSKNDWDHLYD